MMISERAFIQVYIDFNAALRRFDCVAFDFYEICISGIVIGYTKSIGNKSC